MDNYQVVFDISQKGFYWLPVLIPFVISLVLFGLVNVERRGKNTSLLRVCFYLSGLTVCLLVGLFVLWSTYSTYNTAQEILRDNKARVVAGPVENFQPLLHLRHGVESFIVQGVRFSYSDAAITPGFNNTSGNGGPIKAGLQVRIYYAYLENDTVKNTILRLEVKS